MGDTNFELTKGPYALGPYAPHNFSKDQAFVEAYVSVNHFNFNPLLVF